jgi:hypothetical protein
MKNGLTVHSTQLHDYRRISKILQTDKKLEVELYIRASYGTHTDSNGKIIKFVNEGTYPSYKLACKAAKAFQEVAREWEKSTRVT